MIVRGSRSRWPSGTAPASAPRGRAGSRRGSAPRSGLAARPARARRARPSLGGRRRRPGRLGRRSLGSVMSGRPSTAVRRPDAPLPRSALDDLGDGRPGAHEVRGATGDERARPASSARSSSAVVERPGQDGVRDADLHDACAHPTRRRRAGRARAANAAARRVGVAGRRARSAPRRSRRPRPARRGVGLPALLRRRRSGSGRTDAAGPTRPPCSRMAAAVSAGAGPVARRARGTAR